jgi:hypothetical protein
MKSHVNTTGYERLRAVSQMLSQVRARAWGPANAAIVRGREQAMRVAKALAEIRRQGPVAALPARDHGGRR